jgi:hypothetical protein
VKIDLLKKLQNTLMFKIVQEFTFLELEFGLGFPTLLLATVELIQSFGSCFEVVFVMILASGSV